MGVRLCGRARGHPCVDDGRTYPQIDGKLAAGVAHVAGHLPVRFLPGIVEIMALGFALNRGPNGGL